MNISLEAIFTIGIAVFLLGLFLPLAFRKVPMNHVYGFRTAESLKSDHDWYEINANGGRIVAYSLLPVLAAGLAKLFISEDAVVYVNLGAIALPLAICWFMFRREKLKSR